MYTQELTFYFPQNLSHIAAYIATFLEIGFSILLIVGYKTKYTANGTGFLMLLFAISMSLAMGIKAPLDYSVWVSSAASFLLAEQTSFKWSIDSLLKK